VARGDDDVRVADPGVRGEACAPRGSGDRTDPWRYRLENEDDAYMDRGELPPLRDDMREIIG
jgi:hypothetical protein